MEPCGGRQYQFGWMMFNTVTYELRNVNVSYVEYLSYYNDVT